MSDLIVDSCVAAKWVLPEPEGDLAEKITLDAAARGEKVRSLDLAVVEVANSIWKLAHRKKIQPHEAAEFLADFRRMTIEVDPALPLVERGIEIALHYDLAVYDAIFVASVEANGHEGVTADDALVKKVGADYPQIKLLRNW
jgi:predicted nucleic acid-binding protein